MADRADRLRVFGYCRQCFRGDHIESPMTDAACCPTCGHILPNAKKETLVVYEMMKASKDLCEEMSRRVEKRK